MIFFVVLGCLAVTAEVLFNHVNKKQFIPKNVEFERLKKHYLCVYFLATFSDWLQGPYLYKLYSDYGYEEEEIAVLYMVGFASSSVFGGIVGFLADKYGRKTLCVSFGFLYSLCCLTKLSSDFYVLFLGRIIGGISTSILFSTFESWYINEHVNHLKLPSAWLNITFSKANFYTGLLAILAGVICQICVEGMNLGSVSPYVLAIPFLLLSSFIIWKTWEEHSFACDATNQSFIAPLKLIIFKDPLLLLIGLVQSMFETVMYIFVFSWTPIISDLDPPLGIVFASFMLSFMIGSNMYSLLLSDRLPPQSILVFTLTVAFLSISTVAVLINSIFYYSIDIGGRAVQIQLCFCCFLLYEMCVGLYNPVMSYLKGRVVPEQYRASISNWFRVPMNIFTCVSLSINQFSNKGKRSFSKDLLVFEKFYLIYFLCAFLLFIATWASLAFKKKYTLKFSQNESLCVLTINNIKQPDCVEDISVSS